MIRPLLVALACAAPLLAEPREEAALRKTLESLQGDWGVKSMTVAGTQSDAAALRGLSFSFEGDRIVKGNQPEESARLNLDVSGRIPKVEFIDRNGVTMSGVIMRSGDRVWLCVAEAGDRPPPTSFESTQENRAVLIEMTRQPR
jgi:uncharacterized protein (TIGR03067 family)